MKHVAPGKQTQRDARASGVRIVPHGDVWDLRDLWMNRELGHYCITTRHGRVLGQPPRKYRNFAELLAELGQRRK